MVNKQKKFIFCHIPKSAGTLFGQILERNFKSRFYPYYGLWDNRFFTKEDVVGMCKLHPQYDCLASHMFSLNLPYDFEEKDIKAITFIRNPVDRALSLYFYTFRMAKLNSGFKPPESIENFFDALFSDKENRRFCNAQFGFLLGHHSFEVGISEIEMLANSGNLFIAPVERFDDACILLEYKYPNYFRNTAYGLRRNVAERDREVPVHITKMLTDHNKLDLDLHKIAEHLLDKNLNAVFKDNKSLRNAREHYYSRCQRIRLLDSFKKHLNILFPFRNF